MEVLKAILKVLGDKLSREFAAVELLPLLCIAIIGIAFTAQAEGIVKSAPKRWLWWPRHLWYLAGAALVMGIAVINHQPGLLSCTAAILGSAAYPVLRWLSEKRFGKNLVAAPLDTLDPPPEMVEKPLPQNPIPSEFRDK